MFSGGGGVSFTGIGNGSGPRTWVHKHFLIHFEKTCAFSWACVFVE